MPKTRDKGKQPAPPTADEDEEEEDESPWLLHNDLGPLQKINTQWANTPVDPTGKLAFCCFACGQLFVTPSTLLKHRKMHRREDPTFADFDFTPEECTVKLRVTPKGFVTTDHPVAGLQAELIEEQSALEKQIGAKKTTLKTADKAVAQAKAHRKEVFDDLATMTARNDMLVSLKYHKAGDKIHRPKLLVAEPRLAEAGTTGQSPTSSRVRRRSRSPNHPPPT